MNHNNALVGHEVVRLSPFPTRALSFRMRVIRGADYEGLVYASDGDLTALIAPQASSAHRSCYTITIIPTKNITEEPVVEEEVPPPFPLPVPSRFDWSRLARREQTNLRRREQQLAGHLGVPEGVNEGGRLIFAALSKTLPCRWHEDGETIVVMEEVLVCAPNYDNCRGNMKTAPSLIARVRRMVEMERQRLGLSK